MIAGRILSVHVGRAAELRGKPGKKSAIDKRAVQGPVALGRFGLEGDIQVDLRYHGGPHKAVCAYCTRYHHEWEKVYGVSMPPGSFGENIHLEGPGDDAVCLGDLYGAGETRLRVTGPRGPCSNLAAHWGVKDLHLRIKKERKTGFYLLVEAPGNLEAGQELILLERPHPKWSLPAFWDRLDGPLPPADELQDLLAIPTLDPDWAPNLQRMLARAGEGPG